MIKGRPFTVHVEGLPGTRKSTFIEEMIRSVPEHWSVTRIGDHTISVYKKDELRPYISPVPPEAYTMPMVDSPDEGDLVKALEVISNQLHWQNCFLHQALGAKYVVPQHREDRDPHSATSTKG